MRKILYLLLCLTCSVLARAQSSVTYRYWFDGRLSTLVTATGDVEQIVSADVSQLAEGLHTIHLQAADGKGNLSSPQSHWFVKTSMASADLRMRYWFDDDEANGGILNGSSVATELNVSPLKEGLHTLNVQALGKSPSAVRRSYFLKVPQVKEYSTLKCAVSIDGVEYLVQDVANDGGALHLDLDALPLSDGVHNLTALVVTPGGIASSVCSAWFVRVNTLDEISRMKCFYCIDGAAGRTIAGDVTSGNFHFDLDVADLTDGLHQMTYFLVTESGRTTAMRTTFFMKIPLGGEGVCAYEYWLNRDYDNRTLVNLEKRLTHFDLIDLLPVESQPLRSESFHFEYKDGAPYIYAQNDFHIRFYEASMRSADKCATYTDYSVGEPVEGAQLLESGKPVVKDRPAENEIQWYHFPAQTGDSLSFRVDYPCTLQVFAPSGKEMYSVSGSEAVEWDGFHAWEDGEYYLALHDVTANYASRTTLSMFHLDKYAVLQSSPDEVGAAPGYFHVSLFGNGYDKLTNAVLRMGDVHLTADTCVAADISNATLEFFMPSGGQPLGDYDLELYFSDNGVEEKLVVEKAVRVAEAVYGDIEIAVSSLPRVAKPYPVTVKITNTGNVAYQMVPVVFGMSNPEDMEEISTLNFNLGLSPEAEKEGVKLFMETDNLLGMGVPGVLLPMILPQLGAYETKELRMGFVTGPHAKFDFYAWHYTPWSMLSNNNGGIATVADGDTDTSSGNDNGADNPTCEMNPCEMMGGMQCACGIAWGTISAIANSHLAVYNNYQRKKADAYAGNMEYLGELSERGYFNTVPLRSPADIVAGVVGDCAGSGLVGQIIQTFTNSVSALLNNNCKGSTPNRVDPYMPGDPNDMLGYRHPESRSTFVGEGITDVYYNIEFENDPEIANAAAHHIVITDTLDANLLDLSTFAPTSVKFGQYQMMLDGTEQSFVKTLDMRPAVNAIAQISLDYDAKKGIAVWDIQSLDPISLEPTDDAMMGILPVNTDDGRGEGEVTFNIALRPALADGTEIPNRASIVFDSEAAILTPVWRNVIDNVTPESGILDVSVEDDTTAVVHVEGIDDRSGVWRYNLYVQYGDESAWVLAVENADTADICVKIADGMSYGFCVLATDSAGNVERKELHREFSIGKYLRGDANSDGVVDLQDAVLVVQYFVEAPDTYLNALAADYNADGVIDLQDAVAIVGKYVSSDTKKKSPRKRLIQIITEQ